MTRRALDTTGRRPFEGGSAGGTNGKVKVVPSYRKLGPETIITSYVPPVIKPVPANQPVLQPAGTIPSAPPNVPIDQPVATGLMPHGPQNGAFGPQGPATFGPSIAPMMDATGEQVTTAGELGFLSTAQGQMLLLGLLAVGALALGAAVRRR